MMLYALYPYIARKDCLVVDMEHIEDPADSYQQLKLLTEDYEIWIHQFENPYI